MRPDLWRFRIHIRTKIAKHHQRLGLACVFKRHAGVRAICGTEIFILGQFTEADKFGRIQRLTVDPAESLNTDQSVSAIVRNYALHTRLDRKFFGREVLFAIDLAVHYPAIDKPFLACVTHRYRLEIMIVLKAWVHIRFPVELRDDEIQVVVFGFRHVLDKQVPGHITALDHALIHPEYVAAPLRFIGAKAAGRMEDAWADEPTGSWLQAISFRQVE